MGHRHVSDSFMILGIDQHDNNHSLVEQSCIPMVRAVSMENGPFVAPMDHMLRAGVHSYCHWDVGGGSNEHHSSNFSMELQNHPPPFSRPPVDPYTHSSINGNTSLTPMTPVGHIQSTRYNMLNSTAGNGIGGPYKRKIPVVSEPGYGVGSSSSSQMLIEIPAVDRLSLPPYRGGPSLSIDGQDSIRNVRSRSRAELGTRTRVPSYGSHYYQTTTHSANYCDRVHPVNLSADGTNREWNSVPYAASSHGRTLPPDINGPRHETREFYCGGGSADMDPSFSRTNLVSSMQHPTHVSHARDGHNNCSGRVTPLYMNGPVYYNNTHGGTSSTNELHFPSRYSSHSPPGGYRNGRPRIVVGRHPTIVDVHAGLGHETMTIVDQSSFYRNSINLLDQYQDMRLDIDNMSYEELLALEERIGDVSTGLTEDRMSKCLRVQVYSSVDQNHEEPTCSICLEEYKNGEKVGRMQKCGHDYHYDCIKKWLMMKKLCPICKSECFQVLITPPIFL